MSVFIVDEDGQVFHSPIALDAFSYYRDYVLVRTFREFLEINPKSHEGGWVDYSGSDYWEFETWNDVHWEGKALVFDSDDSADLTARNQTFPDGEKPFTRYLTPSHIRMTATDRYGVPKTRTMSVGAFSDTEWMESLLSGDNLAGHILWYNGTIPPSGIPNNYLTHLDITGFNSAKGDRIEKIEFKFDRLPDWNALDYFRDISDVAPETPFAYHYTPAGENGGAPIIGHSIGGPNEVYFSIWGGSSWSNYDLGISTYYPPYFQISCDKDDVVHIIIPFTDPIPPYPTGYEYDTYRYDWTLSGGVVGPFSMHPTEALSTFEGYNYQVVYDPDGYTHFYYVTVERNGAEAPDAPYRIRHYYENASGWHNELMMYVGHYPDWLYTTFTDPCEAYLDSYGRSHYFHAVRDHTLIAYGVLYLHNRDGSWKDEILYPFGGNNSNVLRAWIVGNQQYLLMAHDQQSLGGLVLYQKAWAETDWTINWILAEGETPSSIRKKYRFVDKIIISEDGLFAHLLYTGEGSAGNSRAWEYYKLNILTLEMEQQYVFGYPNPVYKADELEVDFHDTIGNLKNGIPTIFSQPDATYKGFIETTILE